MGKFVDLTGQRFGRLIVVRRVGSDKSKHSRWLCKCDCGNEKIISSSGFRNTKSCGCLAKEIIRNRMTKHNMYGSRINRIWQRIKTRCNNSNVENYKYYGGRGIKICDEWLDKENGFINFYNWAMDNGYKEDLTIDRIDVNGDYEPNNCRWVTNSEQQNNKRNNHIIEYYGQKYTISQLSKYLGVNTATLRNRIMQNWKQEELSLPTNYNRYKRKK